MVRPARRETHSTRVAPSSAPLTDRLAAAREAAELLRAHVLVELEDREWRATPVDAHAAAGRTAAEWLRHGEVDPTR